MARLCVHPVGDSRALTVSDKSRWQGTWAGMGRKRQDTAPPPSPVLFPKEAVGPGAGFAAPSGKVPFQMRTLSSRTLHTDNTARSLTHAPRVWSERRGRSRGPAQRTGHSEAACVAPESSTHCLGGASGEQGAIPPRHVTWETRSGKEPVREVSGHQGGRPGEAGHGERLEMTQKVAGVSAWDVTGASGDSCPGVS